MIYVHTQVSAIGLHSVSLAVGATAAVMIGCSLSMSGLGYFFNAFDRLTAYRKYLGVIGFWLALLYSLLLAYSDQARYVYGLLDNLTAPDVFLGLSAMSILAFLTLISNQTAVKLLGSIWWRRLLRLAYVAYILLAIRAYTMEKEVWSKWLRLPDGLPPVRLLLTFFVIAVVGLRVAVELSKFSQKSPPTLSSSQPPPQAK